MRNASRLLMLVLLIGCSSKKADPGDCTANDDCGAGQVCADSQCRDVCVVNSDCSGGMICSLGMCQEGEAGLAPRIDTVVGNGNAGPSYVRDRLLVGGQYFSGAAFTLRGDVLTEELSLLDVSDTSVVALLPTDIAPGSYTLTAVNQGGAGGATVNLLADPATPAEVLALLVQADGASSGLDADLLDGADSSAFALKSELTAYALQAELANYAPLASIDGMVTADGSGNVAVGGDVVVDGEVVYTTPKQTWIQVMPTDFEPSGSAGAQVIGRDWANAVFKIAGETNHVYATPHLRHGATINHFSCIFDDTSAAGDPEVVFYRQVWPGGTQQAIATANTGGATSETNTEHAGTVATGRALVDLDGYIYYLYGTFGDVDGTSVKIRRCKIGLTYDAP